MNITEQLLCALISISIGGSVMYIGVKVYDQVEETMSFTTLATDPNISISQLEIRAKQEAERRAAQAKSYAAQVQ